MTNDLSEFVAEAAGAPRVLEFGGHKYQLEPELPALVVIKASRFRRDGVGEDTEVDPDAMFDMLDQVFGRELLDTICAENRVPVTELGELLQAGLRAYGLGAEGNREARRANGRAGRSTSRTTGRR